VHRAPSFHGSADRCSVAVPRSNAQVQILPESTPDFAIFAIDLSGPD